MRENSKNILYFRSARGRFSVRGPFWRTRSEAILSPAAQAIRLRQRRLIFAICKTSQVVNRTEVDQENQRAAWQFADGKNTEVVMETTIYNLTQEESTSLAHFGADQTQNWLIVRLPEEESADEFAQQQ